MRNYYYLLIILLGLSCSNEPNAEQKVQEVNAIKTQTKDITSASIDAPRIYCNIDGQQWQGGAVNGSLIKENELEITIVDITGVAPIKNNVDFTTMLNLHIRNFKGVGTYDKDIGFSIKKLYRDQPDLMEDQTEIGVLEVTKWDVETRTISGEFSTTIPTKTKRKHDVENGHFYNIVLKEVNIH